MNKLLLVLTILISGSLSADFFNAVSESQNEEKAPDRPTSSTAELSDPNSNGGGTSTAAAVAADICAGNGFSVPLELLETFRANESLTFEVTPSGNLVSSRIRYAKCFIDQLDFFPMQVDDYIVVKAEASCAGSSSCTGDFGQLTQLTRCIEDAQANPNSDEAKVGRLIIPLENSSVVRSGPVRWAFRGEISEFNSTFENPNGGGINIANNAYPIQPDSENNHCLNVRRFAGDPVYRTQRDQRLAEVNRVCANGTVQEILSEVNSESNQAIKRVLETVAMENLSSQLATYVGLVRNLTDQPNSIRQLTSPGAEFEGLFENLRTILMGSSNSGTDGIVNRRLAIRNRIRELARVQSNPAVQAELTQLREEQRKIDIFLGNIVTAFGANGIEGNLIQAGMFAEVAQAKGSYYVAQSARQQLASNQGRLVLGSIIGNARNGLVNWERQVLNPRIQAFRRQQEQQSIISNIAQFGPDGNFQSPGLQQNLVMQQWQIQQAQRNLQQSQHQYMQDLARTCNDTISAGPIQLSGLRSFTPGQQRSRAQRCLNHQREIATGNNAAQLQIRNQMLRAQQLQEYLQFVQQAEQQGIQQWQQQQQQQIAAQNAQQPFTVNPSDRLTLSGTGPAVTDPYLTYSHPFNMDVQMQGLPYAMNPAFNPGAVNNNGLNSSFMNPNFLQTNPNGISPVYANNPNTAGILYQNPNFFAPGNGGASRSPALAPPIPGVQGNRLW